LNDAVAGNLGELRRKRHNRDFQNPLFSPSYLSHQGSCFDFCVLIERMTLMNPQESINRQRIEEAARALKSGRLVVMPTETVYGLAANALDPEAVARIFEAKERPRFNPLIVHVADRKMLESLTEPFPLPLQRLADRFWPGPLTLVVPRRETVPAIVSAGMPTVAIRIPAHPVAQALIRAAGVPLAAPSANRFMELSPTSAGEISPAIRNQAEMVLDGGKCEVGLESTILAHLDGKLRLLRAGGLAVEELESCAGPIELSLPREILAPGMLKRHYAPRTPCRLNPNPPEPEGKKIGLLSLGPRDGLRRVRI
jgi:L-threonylcarbamoyladenylate synthase